MAVLKYLLGEDRENPRDWIYSTPMFRKLYEGAARANIKRSLARLAKGEVLRMVR
jgi:predicted metal-dependent HD superfamily phosphohydrolase